MLLLSTDSLSRYGLNRIFQFVKKAGYDGIDLKITKNFDTQDVAYLKGLQEEHKLHIHSVQVEDKPTIKKTKLAIEVAIGVGASVVVIEPPKLLDYNYKKWILKEMRLIQKKESIKLCLTNVPDVKHLGIIPKYQMTGITDLKRFKHVCLDTANVYSRKSDLMTYYMALRSHVSHIFLANVKINSSRHLLPTKGGVAPLESFLLKLKDDGYRGAVTLKVDPRSLQTGGEDRLLERLKEVKTFYKKYFLS